MGLARRAAVALRPRAHRLLHARDSLSSRRVQSGKETKDIYKCPVYKTQSRGPTYVFTAGLRTKAPPSKWVLAGLALVMDVVE
jgi:dynein heavy chain